MRRSACRGGNLLKVSHTCVQEVQGATPVAESHRRAASGVSAPVARAVVESEDRPQQRKRTTQRAVAPSIVLTKRETMPVPAARLTNDIHSKSSRASRCSVRVTWTCLHNAWFNANQTGGAGPDSATHPLKIQAVTAMLKHSAPNHLSRI